MGIPKFKSQWARCACSDSSRAIAPQRFKLLSRLRNGLSLLIKKSAPLLQKPLFTPQSVAVSFSSRERTSTKAWPFSRKTSPNRSKKLRSKKYSREEREGNKGNHRRAYEEQASCQLS